MSSISINNVSYNVFRLFVRWPSQLRNPLSLSKFRITKSIQLNLKCSLWVHYHRLSKVFSLCFNTHSIDTHFALQILLPFVKNVMLLILTLLFAGMKVYATDDKELIMELSVKWAGNPNIIVAAKAFGLKATVQVCFCSALSPRN